MDQKKYASLFLYPLLVCRGHVRNTKYRRQANTIGTYLRHPINSGLTRWRLTVYMWMLSQKAVGIPRISTNFGPSVKNERPGVGRDNHTCLARPNSQARTGTGNTHFPCSGDHKQDWQPYSVDPYSAESADHITSYYFVDSLTQPI